MNKRQIKKIKQLKFIKLVNTVGKDDILVFEYDADKATHSDIHDAVIQIINIVDNKVLFIDKDMLKLTSKRDKLETISMLENYIYELGKGL